jgi:Na+/H+ antiporter NhaD/arsenite permease-like protein
MSDINPVTTTQQKKSFSVLRLVIRFLRREPVLSIALFAAVVSMFFVQPSADYAAYIDWKVLACLFCLMAVVSGLRKTGLFDIAAAAITRFAGSLKGISLILIFLTFFVSMAITNDVALITFVPFSLIVLKDISNRNTRMRVIVLQTIAANVGSSLTPVGNPQNLYLFSFYHMSARDFFVAIGPVVLLGGGVLFLAGLFIPDEKLEPKSKAANYHLNAFHCSIYGILFVLSVMTVFRLIDHRIATGIVILVMLIMDRSVFAKIDYSLLFTFLGFFIFIGNLQQLGVVNEFLTSIVGKNVLLVSALASQVISNVPAAILLSHFTQDAANLLRGVSIGGMGTIIGSLASVISFKFFSREYPESTPRYFAIFSIWNVMFLVILYILCIVM